jgi:CBS domain-containing protein
MIMMRSSFAFLSLVSLATAFSAGRIFVSTPTKNPARLVSDCMTPNPKTLNPRDTVDEAISKLLKYSYSGAPVVDDLGNLVGVVSAFDFLQKEAGGALLPMEGTTARIEHFVEAARKIVATQVQDLMSSYPTTVAPQVSMRQAASIMTQERLHRLPVVDGDGKLVGMLSSSDVMKDVLGTVRAALPAESSNSNTIPNTSDHHGDAAASSSSSSFANKDNTNLSP